MSICRHKECDEEPCKEVILKPLEDGEEEKEKEEQKKEQSKGKKISATMETNDRLTPQNCVVQPLLTGTVYLPYRI